MTPKTQSVCKHCGEKIVKLPTYEYWRDSSTLNPFCNGRHGKAHEPVAEPASTGEPPPRIEDYQELCAELYQVAGVLHYANLVPTLLLNKLSAAQRGMPIPKGDLLPFMLSDDLLPSENPATNEGIPIRFTSGAARPSEPSAPQMNAEPLKKCVKEGPDCDCVTVCKFDAAPQPVSGPKCETCLDKGVVLDSATQLVVDCPECDNPNVEG